MQAATLDTLVNLVAAGYGATLIPALAADTFGRRDIAIRKLAGHSARTIRLASRPGFARPQALPLWKKSFIRQWALASIGPECRLLQPVEKSGEIPRNPTFPGRIG